MGLQASLAASISYALTGAPDLGTAKAEFAGHAHDEIASGTGNNQADRVFSDRRTLASAANEDLDLSGSLADPIGGSAVFVKIKAILIKSLQANTTNLTVKPASSNGFTGPFGAATHTLTIPPGGTVALFAPVAGWAVTAGTADLFNVANASGASASYEIVVVGTSA